MLYILGLAAIENRVIYETYIHYSQIACTGEITQVLQSVIVKYFLSIIKLRPYICFLIYILLNAQL